METKNSKLVFIPKPKLTDKLTVNLFEKVEAKSAMNNFIVDDNDIFIMPKFKQNFLFILSK